MAHAHWNWRYEYKMKRWESGAMGWCPTEWAFLTCNPNNARGKRKLWISLSDFIWQAVCGDSWLWRGIHVTVLTSPILGTATCLRYPKLLPQPYAYPNIAIYYRQDRTVGREIHNASGSPRTGFTPSNKIHHLNKPTTGAITSSVSAPRYV